jgi:hypothetical protein
MPIRDVGIDCTTSADYKVFYEGETVGISSRCFNAAFQEELEGQIIRRPACLQVACNATSRKIVVGSGENQTVCNHDGETISFGFPAFSYFECPRVAAICPQLFCPAGCSARGICNWDADPPVCECFDTEDSTDGCYGEYSPSAAPSEIPTVVPTLSASPSEEEVVQEPTGSSSPSFAIFITVFNLVATTMLLIGC